MARNGYTTIALPTELTEKIDANIKRKAEGYCSRAEFIKEAVRKRLEGNGENY